MGREFCPEGACSLAGAAGTRGQRRTATSAKGTQEGAAAGPQGGVTGWAQRQEKGSG